MFCNPLVRPARAALLIGIAAGAIAAGSASAQPTEPSMTTGALFGRNFACMMTNLTERNVRVVFETIDFGGDLIETDEQAVAPGAAFASRDNAAQERFQYCRFAFPDLRRREFRRLKRDPPAAICVRESDGCRGTLVAQ